MIGLDVAVLILLAQTETARARAPIETGARRAAVDLEDRYDLEPDGSGGYRWQGTGFVASVAPDGAVHFEDQGPLPAETTVPVRALAQALKDANPPPRPAGATPQVHGPGRGSGPQSAGLLNALGRNAVKLITNPTLVVNDEELRHDPHHAAKMRFIAGTAKFREGLRVAQDRKNVSGAVGEIRSRVQTIADDESLPIEQRHQLVFELWDECAASPAGEAARSAIEQEVGRQFAKATPRGFTSAELARLNTGQKRAPFSPYAAARSHAGPVSP